MNKMNCDFFVFVLTYTLFKTLKKTIELMIYLINCIDFLISKIVDRHVHPVNIMMALGRSANVWFCFVWVRTGPRQICYLNLIAVQ